MPMSKRLKKHIDDCMTFLPDPHKPEMTLSNLIDFLQEEWNNVEGSYGALFHQLGKATDTTKDLAAWAVQQPMKELQANRERQTSLVRLIEQIRQAEARAMEANPGKYAAAKGSK